MRRLISLVTCVCFTGLAIASGAAEPPTPDTSAALIPTLVDQLGSEVFTDREAATAKLEMIGLPALPALRLAARSENPEVRERAIKILERLLRVTESIKQLTAKTIALSYKDVMLGSAVNDLKTRTGLNIALDPNRISNPLRRITCETKELPVWEALEAFCTAADLREVFSAELESPKTQNTRRGYVPPPPPPNADTVPVVLIDGKRDRLPGDRSTAVRVLALPPTFSGHRVTLGTGEISLCFDVTPVPGLGWQEVTAVKVSRLIDNAGRSGAAGTEKNPLPTFDPSGTIMFARPGVAFRFDNMGNTLLPDTLLNPRLVPVPIRISTPNANSLKRLEGLVFGEINVQNQQLISVSEPKRNTNTPISGPGDLRLTILEVKDAPGPGGLGTIRAQLEYPSPWLTNSRRRGGFNPVWPEAPQNPRQGYRIEALDAAGKTFPISGGSSFADTSDDGFIMIQTLQFNFRPNSGIPAKLVVVGPKTVTVQVPFALENVPLP